MSIISKNFQKDLKELLEKYNATISFGCSSCSDTHGIYDAHIEITCQPDPKSFKEYTLLNVNGWSMNSNDIDNEPEEFTVMGVNDWPEYGQKDFEITFVKNGESFQKAIERAKQFYNNDQLCYIVNKNNEIVHPIS